MQTPSEHVDSGNSSRSNVENASGFGLLIEALASEDARVRRDARSSLVQIGQPAVPALLSVLTGTDPDLRWEAARALREIGDPRAAPALVQALEDRNFDIRWIAAEGLIALGRNGLRPLLSALAYGPPSPWLLEGAHHILDACGRPEMLPAAVQPVLAALEGIEPGLAVSPVAETALMALFGGLEAASVCGMSIGDVESAQGSESKVREDR